MDISFDLQDGIAVITMDDGKKNALTREALDQLHEAMDQAEEVADAIVLAGRPGSFCAGFDINVMTGGDEDAASTLSLQGGRMALRLYECPKPVLAACTGHAFTIGALWLLASDTRIGEKGKFKFGMTETALNRVLPIWARELLVTRLNPVLYTRIVTQSKILSTKSAVKAGFLDVLVDEGEAVAAAIAEASELARLPARAYAGNKLDLRHDSLERMRDDLGFLR